MKLRKKVLLVVIAIVWLVLTFHVMTVNACLEIPLVRIFEFACVCVLPGIATWLALE